MRIALLCLVVMCVSQVHGNLLVKQTVFEEPDMEVLSATWKKFEQNLRGVTDSAVKEIIVRVIRATSEVDISDGCYDSLQKLLFGLRNLKLWAAKFLDSAGKPASGYIIGSVSSFGSYDECIEIQVPGPDPTQMDFRGQYCLLDFHFLMPPKPRYYNLIDRVAGLENFTMETEVMEKIVNNSFINYFMAYRFGICVPSTCTIEDVRSVAKYVGKQVNLESNVPTCETKENISPDSVQMGIICAMIAVGILVFILTIIDVAPMFWSCGGSEKSFENLMFPFQLARACSLNANTIRLVDTSSPEPRTDCLHGIKFFSICWVILGHSYMFINWQMIRHHEFTKDEIMKPIFQVVLNAYISVDTFFTITTFLVVSIAIQLVDKLGKNIFNVPLFVINRICRLLPMMVLTTGLAILFPLIGDGPIWHQTVDIVANNCRRNWWYNFLFIGNFLNPRESCLPHFWYSICDMQLIVVSVIFLLLAIRKPLLATAFASVIMGISCIITMATTYVKDLQPTILLITPDSDTVIDAWKNSHFMPFVHGAPYGIGLLYGYLFARHPNLKIRPIIQCLLWIVSFSCGLLVVYGTSWWNAGKHWALAETLIYAGLHRISWAFAIGWVIYACATQRGGVVNRILSWKGFVPASRLTYSAYMIHCLVIWFFVGHTRGEREGQVEATWLFLGNVTVTFGLAYLGYIFVEAPANQIFKVVALKLFTPPKKQEHCNGVCVEKQGVCSSPPTIDTEVHEKYTQRLYNDPVNTKL